MAYPNILMNRESVFLKVLQEAKLYTKNSTNQLQIAYRTQKVKIDDLSASIPVQQTQDRFVDH